MNGPAIEQERSLHGAGSAQARASDPSSSAWVTANAGSGKTHVLVQRVLRLLLNGAAPSRILCLTFTRSAAANMAGRVFRELARWTSIDDRALTEAIAGSGAPAPDSTQLAFARRLFARTIETPGGLKIETIHSFCGRLLRMFPFEANVAAGFRIGEERESRQLLEEARAEALTRLGRDPAAIASLDLLAREIGREGLETLIGQALARRAIIDEALEYWGGVAAYGEALARRLGLAPDEDVASVEAAILSGLGGRAAWSAIADQLDEGRPNDGKLAAALREAANAADRAAVLSCYLSVFFTNDDKPRGGELRRLITKDLVKNDPALEARLRVEQARLIALREKLNAARTVARSVALIAVAEQVIRAYGRLKATRGVLDFDDLIERTTALLARADAAWILYKLDSGIDHILVDEAQDTSREQWEILQRLAEDFTAGKSARETVRTFFAVGDDKQSIFSFQGAAPEMFAEMRRLLRKRHVDANMPFAAVPLTLSYRSAKIVLDGVDGVFAIETAWRGLTSENEKPLPHIAFRAELPGLVELWPLIAGENDAPAADWQLPLDKPTIRDPPVVLARRIAAVIADWLKPDSAERIHDRESSAPRPIRPGDVLILVRTRGAFFEAMIRALKDAEVKTFGADRLTLADHIAVMDLAAAGNAALSLDDDLSLAATLKSPLFGFDDDDLIELAARRNGSLAEALAARSEEKYRAASRRLKIWSERARFHSPYDFYARLLGEEGARRAMLARLGPEAGDAIDEFLSQALSFERRRPPSLLTFLTEIAEADVSIKRDMEEGVDAVRVMTIHAAKGLEAPVVFLPDTCAGVGGGRGDEPLFTLRESAPNEPPSLVWSPRRAEDAAAVAPAREARREAARGEHRRLLYVAMTRAAERLIVAGFHGVRGKAADCWYDMIETGLRDRLVAAPAPWSASEAIWRMGGGAKAEIGALPGGAVPEPPAPVWLAAPAPAPSVRAALTAAPATPQGGAGGGRRRGRLEAGRLSHALLQYLPDVAPSRRREAGQRFLDRRSAVIDHAEREAILDRTLTLLGTPGLAGLFGPGSRAEAAIAADFAGPGAAPALFSGRIDRLAVCDDHLAIADFKSGSPSSDHGLPVDYVAQLALYRAALRPLYPGRPVRAYLIWLDGPVAIEIDPAMLDDALAQRLSAVACHIM